MSNRSYVSSLDLFKSDFRRFKNSDFKLLSIRSWLMVSLEPGLVFVGLLRIQKTYEKKGLRKMARLVHLLNLKITGGEVGQNLVVGRGLIVKHPLGVVLGNNVEIGAECTILGKVTLGEKFIEAGDYQAGYPVVGDFCILGTNSVLLGGVRVGNKSIVGAGAIVLSDVPEESIAVGVPAKPKKRLNS